jgi:hypothetical protein
MHLTVHIPDDLADRVRRADSARLERAALDATLRAARTASAPCPVMPPTFRRRKRQLACARRARLPEGVSIRELMVHGRA